MSLLSMVLLVFFILADLLQLSHCVYITVQPVSINTTLNSTVVFSCEAIAGHPSFTVNGEVANDETVIGRGFSATSKNYGSGTKRAELQAIAHEYNNNTYISCRALIEDPDLMTELSDTAILMIQGLLSGVSNLDYTFINRSSVLLTWTAPYTLDNVPITGYYIVNGSVNITTTNNNTNITLSATNPNPCVLNNVLVSPINDVGIGSSSNRNFYYQTAPLTTPNVSVVLVIDKATKISFNISVYVGRLCIGEYPNNVTVTILTTNNEIQDSTSIPTQVNDQLMITGAITVPNNLNTFILNVSLSNNGGEFLPTPSFKFDQIGPVTRIESSIDNCSTIDVSWSGPKIDRDDLAITHYVLKIYDDITGQLLMNVSVYDTNYQFVNKNLFIHRYTYVITGVNNLGEGISNNNTFSYQRVPQSVKNTTVAFSNYTQNTVIFHFSIPIIVECTGEAPENITVTIQCNETVIFHSIYLIVNHQNNVTGSVPMPRYKSNCSVIIVFSNAIGRSEPFLLIFEIHAATTVAISDAESSSISMPVLAGAIIGGIFAILVLIIFTCILVFLCHHIKPKKLKDESPQAYSSISTTEIEPDDPSEIEQGDEDHNDNTTNQPLLMKPEIMKSKSLDLSDAAANPADQKPTRKSSTLPRDLRIHSESIGLALRTESSDSET